MLLSEFIPKLATAVAAQPGLIRCRSCDPNGNLDILGAYVVTVDETCRDAVNLLRHPDLHVLSNSDRAKMTAGVAERALEVALAEIGIKPTKALLDYNDGLTWLDGETVNPDETPRELRNRVGAMLRGGVIPGLMA